MPFVSGPEELRPRLFELLKSDIRQEIFVMLQDEIRYIRERE
jgi:hypothetical protein